MEKRTLIKIILGIIGGLVFSLGLCCCLLPEWNLFSFGLSLAIVGGVLLAVLLIYHFATREHKPRATPLNIQAILAWTIGIAGALLMGFGMSKVMIGKPSQSDMILGISPGIIGLLIDILLFPIYQYLHSNKK